MKNERDTTNTEGLSIANVETMVNNIGNIEAVNNHFYHKAPRPINKIIPLSESEGGLSAKQKNYFTDTINKIVELGEKTGNQQAQYAFVRRQVNDAGGVTSVNLYPQINIKKASKF